jgi:hypothetical protein
MLADQSCRAIMAIGLEAAEVQPVRTCTAEAVE